MKELPEYFEPFVDLLASYIDAREALLFMGWRFLPGDHYPNYCQILDLGKFSSHQIALKMVQALHFAYGVDDTYACVMRPESEASRQWGLSHESLVEKDWATR